jgi:uncharacterized protein YbcI
MSDPINEVRQRQPAGGALLQKVSNALVALHKEQFGRGRTRAESHFAGADALVCVIDDALLPGERAMVEMGEQHRVRESRLFSGAAMARQSIAAVEALTGRTVRAFATATDPDHGVLIENFVFEPDQHRDGPGSPTRPAAGR